MRLDEHALGFDGRDAEFGRDLDLGAVGAGIPGALGDDGADIGLGGRDRRRLVEEIGVSPEARRNSPSLGWLTRASAETLTWPTTAPRALATSVSSGTTHSLPTRGARPA